MQNLEFDGESPKNTIYSQKPSRVSRKSSTHTQQQEPVKATLEQNKAPEMDYFKHVLQKKYADRQAKRRLE